MKRQILLSCLIPISMLASCAVGPLPERRLDRPHLETLDLQNTPSHTTNSVGTFSAHVGWRGMDDTDFWRPLDDQFAGALEFALMPAPQSLALNVGLAGSYDRESRSGNSIDAYTLEFYLGPKFFLDLGRTPLRMYVGAGVELLYANAELRGASRSFRSNDLTFGGYGQLGLMYMLNRRQSIGIEYRTLRWTDVTLGGLPGDADYDQFAFVFANDL